MTLSRILAVTLVATAAALMHGCTTACIRNTDCYTGETCTLGACLLFVQGDGAPSAGGMTGSSSMTSAGGSPTTARTPVTDAAAD